MGNVPLSKFLGEWLPDLETVRKLCEALEIDHMDVDEFKAAIDKTAQDPK